MCDAVGSRVAGYALPTKSLKTAMTIAMPTPTMQAPQAAVISLSAYAAFTDQAGAGGSSASRRVFLRHMLYACERIATDCLHSG